MRIQAKVKVGQYNKNNKSKNKQQQQKIVEIGQMNLQQLIYTIIESNSPKKREQNIQIISQKIIDQIQHLDQVQRDKKVKEQKYLFESFFKVVEQISHEVQQNRKKYQNLDRDKLKEQKCIGLAKDIKLFKQECFHLKNKLTETKAKLKDLRIQNQIMEEQQRCLQTIFTKKTQEKSKRKSQYFAEVFNYENSRPKSTDNKTSTQKVNDNDKQYRTKPKSQSKKESFLLSFSNTFNNFQQQEIINKLSPSNTSAINEYPNRNMNINPNSKTMGNFNKNTNSLKKRKIYQNYQVKGENKTAQFKRFISTSQQPRSKSILNMNSTLFKEKQPENRVKI